MSQLLFVTSGTTVLLNTTELLVRFMVPFHTLEVVPAIPYKMCASLTKISGVQSAVGIELVIDKVSEIIEYGRSE